MLSGSATDDPKTTYRTVNTLASLTDTHNAIAPAGKCCLG